MCITNGVQRYEAHFERKLFFENINKDYLAGNIRKKPMKNNKQ